MSGHLLLFGQDITRPTPAIHHGNGQPYGEIQFPGGVITYRTLADVDELIAAAAELRAMLGDAQARAVVVPPLPLDASGDLYAIPANRIGGISGERCSDPPAESCSDAGCPVHGDVLAAEEEDVDDLEPLPPLPQRKPGASAHPWQAAMDAELSPEALKREAPLATLAPEPQEDEVKR